MSATVFTKGVRDRWIGMTVAVVVLGLMIVLGMWVYGDIDLSIYTDLPEALRSIVGIPVGADPAVMAYNVMLGTTGALTLASLALSMGASAIAGEERDGTLGLLLANPIPRTRVLVSKGAAMVTLVVAGVLLLWGAGRLAPVLLDVEVGTTHVGAMALHVAVNSLFYGFLALAVGAWTGRRPLASGVTVAVMVVSFVGAGLLPLWHPVAWLARAMPWYWFDGSDPLVNGANGAHLAVLAGGIVVLAGVAVAGVNRRDLVLHTTGVSLLDRLRTDPRTRRVADRLAGATRVSHLWVKRLTEHQAVIAVTAALMFWMTVIMGPMYAAMSDDLARFSTDLPQALITVFGGGDMRTAQGFFQIEIFGLVAPIAAILVAALIGARGIAGEEARRTMGLLLANPVRRWRVVTETTVAMVVATVVVGVATFAGMAAGILIARLDVNLVNVAATCVMATLLGLAFGALALALSAASGRTGVATYGTVGIALVAYVANSLLSINGRLAGWARLSPFHYYLGADPLGHGLDGLHAGVLVTIAAVLVALAVVAFRRRDLRLGS